MQHLTQVKLLGNSGNTGGKFNRLPELNFDQVIEVTISERVEKATGPLLSRAG